MALNLDAIKKKLADLTTAKQSNKSLWKPEPGKNVIRIVPSVHSPENPFFELYFHYNFGGKTILSPVSFGDPDPIMEFAEKLKSTRSKEDYQLAKKLTPTMRVYLPILVRGKEDEGVQYWGFGKTVYTELMKIIADDDYGDITDLKTGRDITVEFISAKDAGKDYPETTIRCKPNQSPASPDKKILELIKDQPKVTDNWKTSTYQELEEILENYLMPSEEKADAADINAVDEDAPSVISSKDDVGDAFAALFNK